MNTIKTSNKKILINPDGTEIIYKTMQFSQAVRVGNTLWISGQVGIDEKGMAGVGIEAQARMAFLNLKRALAEAGGSLDDVVELVTNASIRPDKGTAQVGLWPALTC